MDLGERSIQSKKVVTPSDARVNNPGTGLSGFKQHGSAEIEHYKTPLTSFHQICAQHQSIVIKNKV
jgi:hypothetical protein